MTSNPLGGGFRSLALAYTVFITARESTFCLGYESDMKDYDYAWAAHLSQAELAFFFLPQQLVTALTAYLVHE